MIAGSYVTLNPGELDPAGKAVEGSLHALGFGQVSGVRLGKYIEVQLPDGSGPEARAQVEGLQLQALHARVFSAHVMGGCAMGSDLRESVVDESGRHHHVANLSVHDGSIFPTSIGANPQLSIYAQAARMASALAGTLAKA